MTEGGQGVVVAARRHAADNLVDIDRVLMFRSEDDPGALTPAIYRAHDEVILWQQQFASRTDEAAYGEADDFLGSVAAHDAIGVYAVYLPDSPAQRPLGAVRITM